MSIDKHLEILLLAHKWFRDDGVEVAAHHGHRPRLLHPHWQPGDLRGALVVLVVQVAGRIDRRHLLVAAEVQYD